MILLQLRANFGKLHGTLTLHEGLNELCLPNEAGKSTWSAFLLAMLYGIDTRERATRENQNLPAKERYRPWDGSSMEGAIDLIWNGRAITIERRSQGRTPMGVFRAYETESGTPVPELTAENCGRMLCGAERSVFERTAFVRQLGMAVSSDAQLEQRLSALVTTGEEGPSASALEKKLRDLKNKYTYRTGLLPRLQARRDELQAQLSALRAAQAEAMDLSAACAGAEAARSRLQDLRARIERAQAARRRAGLTELQERETALAARCAALAEQTAGLPDEQMLQLLARGLEDAAERLQTAQLDAAIGVKLPEKPEDLPGFAGCGPDEAAQRAREVQVQWNVLHAVRVPKKLPILLPCAAAVLAEIISRSSFPYLSWHLWRHFLPPAQCPWQHFWYPCLRLSGYFPYPSSIRSSYLPRPCPAAPTRCCPLGDSASRYHLRQHSIGCPANTAAQSMLRSGSPRRTCRYCSAYPPRSPAPWRCRRPEKLSSPRPRTGPAISHSSLFPPHHPMIWMCHPAFSMVGIDPDMRVKP